MSSPKGQEGTIPFNIIGANTTCHTWYTIFGDINTALPLIMLHGGPGAGHSDLATLGPSLAQAGIPVICYDQVGCGNSSRVREKADDAAFWTFDLFCAEIDNLVDHFNLRETGFFIHGHSWGGMLASTYAARRPRGLRRLVISCSPASAALYASEAARLFRALPMVNDKVMRMDAEDNFDAPEYKDACAAWLKRHFCRLEPWPEVLEECGRCFDECTMFNLMCVYDTTALMIRLMFDRWGPSRIRMMGSLKNYDAIEKAGNIDVPTLMLTGHYDYMTDNMMKPWSKAIEMVQWVILENSSHMAHLEEPGKYLELLEGFLLSSSDVMS
jgi:proline-specific peptidase